MAKVFLSAGHGGSDPGAVAYGMREKDINLNIMTACRDELQRHGITVVCSRTKDENDKVGSEVAEANASGADVAVSFHTNAGGGDGSESFYYGTSAKGKELATLCENYTKRIGQNSRGTKNGSHLYFIKHTTMPAVLCECAFVDNDKDNDIIDTVSEQKAFGVAYAKAILAYFGIAYKTENTKPVASVSTPTQVPQKTNEFKVKVTTSALNIRKGPGTNNGKTGKVIRDKGIYTIVETSGNWGRLKSGAGWICLDYTKRV